MRFYLEYVHWDFGKNIFAVEWSKRQHPLVSVGLEGARQEAADEKTKLLKVLPPKIGEEGNMYPREFILVGKEAVE